MKKQFLLFFVLLCHLLIFAQQKWLNPTPSGWINSKIQFVNANTGYLLNINGDLFLTTDTGNTWQNHGNFPGGQTFKIEQSTGIIPSSDSSIYISRDTGSTWFKTTGSPGTPLISNWCDIIGTDTIFVLKSVNNFVAALYKSVNRGDSWELINNNIDQFYNTSIDFITSQIGYALKPGGIYKTSDGGVSWQQLYNVSSSANVICMKFYDTLRGVAYRELTGMLRTIDGGLNWAVSNQVVDDIHDIFYTDPLNLFAAGDDGVVYKSADGGSTWTWISPSGRIDAYDLYSQFFFTANDGFITGHRGRLLRTRNGGISWEPHSPTYIDVTSISFGNEFTGYASTWNNLYKTSNSGNTWTALPLTATGNSSRFEHCRFTSSDTGIVTMSFPAKVYKTVDGGLNWTPYTFTGPLPYNNISSVSFTSKDTGYVSLRGSLNSLHKTTNGGSTWQEVGSFQSFNLLHFVNDTFGYATVYDRVYRTSNGGMNWTVMSLPADRPFKSIWFNTAAKGFTVGDGGQLKMTVDSGYTWTDIVLEPFALPDYSMIRFYDNRIGYITDDEGRYYKTVDSGYHWKQNGSVASYESRSILFRPDTTVLFAGMYGSIVSRSIAEYAIDSVQAIPVACGAELSAKVTAFLSPVDTIWFEYGKNGYGNTITGSPVRVSDTALHIYTSISNLQPDSVYHFRVKVLFKGQYYYSSDFVVVPKKAAGPVITATGNQLTSSVISGNQWYLNGTLIPGATGQQYTATANGNYSVTAALNGCPTMVSAVYNLIITAIPDIIQWENEIIITPNPATDNEITISVNNNRRLSLQITDMNGRHVKKTILRNGKNAISVSGLTQGIYLFLISDAKTQETITKKLLKL